MVEALDDPKAQAVQRSYQTALVAAVIIDPGLITAETERPVDVNDQWGMSYGQSLAFGAGGPEGAGKARIVTDMDVERFWKMLDDSLARIAAPAK